jgi:hypothetical protein
MVKGSLNYSKLPRVLPIAVDIPGVDFVISLFHLVNRRILFPAALGVCLCLLLFLGRDVPFRK